MRIVLAFVALAFIGAVLAQEQQFISGDENFPAFMAFVQKYDRKYTSLEEFVARYEVFVSNMKRVAEYRALHQAKTGTSGEEVYGVTKFSDLTPEEFKNFKGFVPPARLPYLSVADHSDVDESALPNSLDWRDKGVVSAVKDQGQCGSCWAFSATEQIESAWAMQKNPMQILSPQQIVSCDTVDSGCDGGYPMSAYQYVQQQGGIDTESAYPYTSGDSGDTGTCQVDTSSLVVNVKNFSYAVPACTDTCNKQNETLLQVQLNKWGPISVCVNAEPWQTYSGGIMTSGCDHGYDDLDHCVQLVGYNKQGSTPYWILRNSWNTDWGIDGYIYVEMGHNLCGLADMSTIVTDVKA